MPKLVFLQKNIANYEIIFDGGTEKKAKRVQSFRFLYLSILFFFPMYLYFPLGKESGRQLCQPLGSAGKMHETTMCMIFILHLNYNKSSHFLKKRGINKCINLMTGEVVEG